MEKVDIKCGFLCNNKCLFCVQGNKRQVYGDIPSDQIFETLEKARKDSDKIVFTGGEVTIKKDFLSYVKKASDLGFSLIQIQTNGRMFSNKDFCKRAIEAGATEFSLALHGHRPECHDFLTQAPGSFYQTAKGIKNLKEFGMYVGTNTVITRSNYRTLPEMARLLIYLGVDQFQFAFVHALGTAAENFLQIVPRYSLIEPYVKEALSYGINAKKFVMTEAIPYCFMEGFTDFIAEKIIPGTKIYDIHIVDDYTDYRLNMGKSKGQQCKECLFVDICEGPWKEYPEYYGWGEFVPIRTKL